MTETLPAEALAWAAQSVDPAAAVVGTRRLTGGVASRVHELRMEVHGRRRSFVLKRPKPDRWRPDAVRIEADTLGALASTAVPSPELVAADPTGDAAGVPSLLMVKQPGRIELRADRTPDYVEQLASMAARVHNDLPVAAPDPVDWTWPDKRAETWSARPALWAAVAAVLADRPTTTSSRFIHGDFQLCNLLWSTTHRLTGVVDWSIAMRASPARDLGSCRLNLAWLHGPDLAERLRLAWEAETGWELDPWWDLWSLSAWDPWWPTFLRRQIMRRVRVDWAGVNERVEALVDVALRRL